MARFQGQKKKNAATPQAKKQEEKVVLFEGDEDDDDDIDMEDDDDSGDDLEIDEEEDDDDEEEIVKTNNSKNQLNKNTPKTPKTQPKTPTNSKTSNATPNKKGSKSEPKTLVSQNKPKIIDRSKPVMGKQPNKNSTLAEKPQNKQNAKSPENLQNKQKTPKRPAENQNQNAKKMKLDARDRRTLFIKGFPTEIKDDEIKALSPDIFYIRRHKKTNRIAFFEFKSEEIAEKNYKLLQNKSLKGEPLIVDYVGVKSTYNKRKDISQKVVDKSKLYISGFPDGTTMDDLKRAFPKAVECIIPRQKKFTSSSFGFATFDNEEDAADAHDNLTELVINGKKVVVLYAIAKEKRENALANCNQTKVQMNEDPSLNDFEESKSSLCELSSHDFAEIQNTITFVDKTLFIKCVLTDSHKTVLLTAPRAFGKSTLMNMLKQFLLGKTSLFNKLKICTEEKLFFSKHCKPHPVIHIDLGNVRGSSFAEVKHKLALAINYTFQEHNYLVKKTHDGTRVWASEKLNISDIDIQNFEKYYLQEKCITLGEGDLQNSLKFLSQVLCIHYEEKVFLLIDEYDAPALGLVLMSCSNKDDMQLINDCLKVFIANTLKFNDFLARSLIFACVRLAGAFSGDAARIIKHFPFLSELRYAPYLGFTYEEVKQLLELPELKAVCGKVTFETIMKWYNGYMVSDSTLKIFSNWSVLNFLVNVYTSGTLKYLSFWIDTGHVSNLEELFAEPSVREKIEQIISCGEIKIRTVKSIDIKHLKSLKELISLEFDEISEKNVDLFLQFLADSGYFNILPVDERKYENTKEDFDAEFNSTSCILRLPNFEIKTHIRNVCYSEALTIMNKHNLRSTDIKRYLNALKLVLENTSERAFVDLANAVLVLFSAPFTSSQRISKEKELHHILYTVAYNSRYFVTHSEVQIKKNRKGPGIANTLDVVIIIKNIGIIFEYKVNSKSAEKALQQIFDKRYYTKFDEPDYEHISKKIYAGLVLNTEKKNVFITYKVGNKGKRKSVCSDK